MAQEQTDTRKAHRRHHGSVDAEAVVAVVVLTVLIVWAPLVGGRALLRTDIVLFFLPMWGFLGERLRAGDIPGWNPAQFAGAPFAGDPESGWMYLPTMLFFTVLSPVIAFKTLIVVHLSIAGLATFALSRVLSMRTPAAVVAGAAYEFGTFLEFTGCCTIYVQIMAWLPVALLGIELAIRARDWLIRVGGWTLAGFAISQMLGAWLGQGAYYGLLVVGGFVFYRTILAPPDEIRRACSGVGDLFLHGAVLLVVGFGLAAAGVLPRLEAISYSTLAGGVYEPAEAMYTTHGGWSPSQAITHLLSIEAAALRYYAGGATLTLALLAPFLARRRYAVPFFALLSVAAFTLTLEETPFHRLLYLLPRFELIHEHYPERALIVFYLGLSLLAGATIDSMPRWRSRSWVLATVGVLPLIALVWTMPRIAREGAAIWPSTAVAVAVVALLLVLYAFVRVEWMRCLVPVLLLLAILVDPTGWRRTADRSWHDHLNTQSQIVLTAYSDRGGAADFLMAGQELEPSRYAGYDPASMAPGSTYHFMLQVPIVPALMVNNRATYVGLHDLSGYNPVQPERFRELLDALNRGQQQDYHQTNLLPSGLDSPLLDLLNVRYLVIPVTVAADRADMQLLMRLYPTVYQDSKVRVLENRDAFPRTWLVHDARQVEPGAALSLLTSSAVNPRTTAVLETDLPPLAPPTNPSADHVEITHYEPDRVQLRARSDAPSLAMLSDTYDPNWRAYVDGEEAPVLVADHALRAIPLPAGEHTIELRFEPRALTIGLAISVATAVLLTGALALLGGARWRHARSGGG